ncbi:hypothetical protein FQN52_004876 [Onygenales sp. PD_12]|nr:hypothetical protein FQN52_004876 [Onygenales sp. PD_12]
MFDMRHAGKWAQRFLEIFTPNFDRPTYAELYDAEFNALMVARHLVVCKETIERRYRITNTDAIRLIDEVLQALRDDHGGTLPSEVLEFWLEKRRDNVRDHWTFSTPDEKKAMVEMWQRWDNLEKVKEQFWVFDIDNYVSKATDSLLSDPSGEISVIQCLSHWLEKRKAGEVYYHWPEKTKAGKFD